MVPPLQQVPVEARVVVPLPPLRDLAPHEEEFLPGVTVHIPIQEPEVRHLLPDVAGHLVEERAFAVDDLVVREREDEVFGERVDQAEGQRAVLVLAIDRVLGHVPQRVVHPPHVPLEAESQPPEVRRLGDARPARRFLGARQDPGMFLMAELVEFLEEVDRFEVLVAAEDVRHPFAGFARIVEIEHRRDRVDPQAVEVVTVQPEQRRCRRGNSGPRAGRS